MNGKGPMVIDVCYNQSELELYFELETDMADAMHCPIS